MTEPRWKNERGISDLSVAVDEVYYLRALLADEAAITEAHLGYKTFPKTRRKYAEEQVVRMRAAAAGDTTTRRDKFDPARALLSAGVDPTLTNHQWAEQRGLISTDLEETP